LIKAAL